MHLEEAGAGAPGAPAPGAPARATVSSGRPPVCPPAPSPHCGHAKRGMQTQRGPRPRRVAEAPLAHTLCPQTPPPTRKDATMTPPSLSALRLESLAGNVALVTFDQPGSRANTLGQAVLGELEALAAYLGSRTDLQGLVFTSGKPGMFIAGADLKELGGPKPDPATARRLVKRGLDVIAAFENLPYPTVACVDGACMGGGLELAMG